MTSMSDDKPPKRRLISGRASRGWVVFAANVGGVLLIGNGIYVSVAMSYAGHPGSGIDFWVVIGSCFCFSLAGTIASRRASNAILSLVEKAIHAIRVAHERPSRFPPLDPTKWPSKHARPLADAPHQKPAKASGLDGSAGKGPAVDGPQRKRRVH